MSGSPRKYRKTGRCGDTMIAAKPTEYLRTIKLFAYFQGPTQGRAVGRAGLRSGPRAGPWPGPYPTQMEGSSPRPGPFPKYLTGAALPQKVEGPGPWPGPFPKTIAELALGPALSSYCQQGGPLVWPFHNTFSRASH